MNNRRANPFEPGPVIFERSGAFRCYFDAGVSKDIVRAILQLDPDDLFDRGEPVSSGRSGNPRDLAKILVNGKWFFLKRYNCQGWFYRVKNMFRLSRARRAMRAGRWLLTSGVPTPKPLICLEERHGRLLGRSYLICPFMEGSRSLFDLWPDLDVACKRLYMQWLGRLMGTLHRSGIIHGDSNWRNILVGKGQDEEPRFWFVDLDGVRRYRCLKAVRAERDIGHFLRELERNGADEEYARLFRRHWQRTLNLD